MRGAVAALVVPTLGQDGEGSTGQQAERSEQERKLFHKWVGGKLSHKPNTNTTGQPT